MELLTNVISENEFRDELRDTMTFLGQLGVQDAAVSFGFVPDLEDVGVRYTVAVQDIASLIADREKTSKKLVANSPVLHPTDRAFLRSHVPLERVRSWSLRVS